MGISSGRQKRYRGMSWSPHHIAGVCPLNLTLREGNACSMASSSILSCVRAWNEGNIGLILKGAPVPVNASDAIGEIRKLHVLAPPSQHLCLR
jgi:hypothetical protein